jgi:hypothetical protein
MPQLDKIMFIYVIFWFLFISLFVYSIFYLYFLLPIINTQKIKNLNFITKINNLGL